MKKDCPSLIILEASAGYGKTYFINHVLPDIYSLKILKLGSFALDNFFESLRDICKSNNVIYSDSSEIFQWYQAFKKSPPFILAIDDFQTLKNNNKINEFLIFLLKNPLDNISIVISSREKIDLPVENIFAEGNARYLDKNTLKISEEEVKSIWQKNDLEWTKDDEKFYNSSDGWNQGVMLYLRYRKQEINQKIFDELLKKSIKEVFSSDFRNIDISDLPDLFKDKADNYLQKNNSYWSYLSKDKRLSPEESQTYLERALNIANAEKNYPQIINLSTRLAHQYSLSGYYQKVDQALDSVKSMLEMENINNVDKIAWLYIKANRLRQVCRHQEALELLEELFKINCNSIAGLNLQTKARVVMGLTEYQMGNYQKTRDYYNNALLLAQAEHNNSLNLEITIMLAFLDRWEGKDNNQLPDNIIELIENQPLKSQPIMFLNLAFYWLLGETVDLDVTSEILEKIKVISKELKLNFLIPLIADIDARLMRFKKEYDKAHECHKLAISNLEKDGFEYIHANLNYSLTILRQGDKDKAKIILEKLLYQATENKLQGIIRQINVILDEISPDAEKVSEIVVKPVTSNLEKIEIRTFGGFQIKIGDRWVNKWSRKKARHLLIHLLLNPRGIHRETLAELIFSSEELDNPLRNLDVNIHSLRKILEPDRKSKESSFILFQDSCYIFNWSYPSKFDLVNFESIYKEWQKEKDNIKKIELSENILNIYSGDFLPEIDFADTWYAEREDLNRKAKNVFNYFIPELIKNNDERSEYWSERMINIDNLNEKGYTYLMKIAKIKKDSQLLKITYQKAVNTFKKELDETPSSELTATYKSIEKEICK